MASAKCRNRASCDLAMQDEWIEIPEDGRCPECGTTLQTQANNSSAIDDARKRRKNLLMAGGGLGALSLTGALLWALNSTPKPGSEPLPPATTITEPAPAEPVASTPAEPTSTEPTLETQQHIKQGMMFVALAKGSPKTRGENLQNALVEFNLAIKQEDDAGRCFATGYMNRGITYWQDNKMNLAEKDLIKATECDEENAVAFYNLATYYATIKKLDLALEPLDKALELGFSDCDVLRKDPDLANLRNKGDFRHILEKHKLFCLK